MNRKVPRRQLILEALAAELEKSPGGRITTAALARASGVSEAALYRHFASKARMFEGLIEFAEESVFARINQIMESEKSTRKRCANVLKLNSFRSITVKSGINVWRVPVDSPESIARISSTKPCGTPARYS